MTSSDPVGPASPTRRAMFETMARIKACDDRLRKGIATGELLTVFWPSRGQEAIAAALGAVLRSDDRLVTTYRGLHDLLAKGVPLVEVLGEMLGRQIGACRGKGGTMHVSAPEVGVMLSTGIVGAGIPVAVGLALAARRQGSDRVVAVCFGDGATNTGSFHEAANLAATWQLPLTLVCQNNQYAEMTPVAETMHVAQIADRAAAYGMPGTRVDGNDPDALHQSLSDAVGRARAGGGPTLVEATTFRFNGHYFGDPMAYIPPEELASAVADDPVPRYGARLIAADVLGADEVTEIEHRAIAEVDDAVRTVLASPPTDLDELDRDVYADMGGIPR